MNKKNYIDKIELILNTSGKYITRKEKDMILDYVNYFKTKNNVIEDKNIELVIEIERLNNIINELEEYHTRSIKNLEKMEEFNFIGVNHIKILHSEHTRILDKIKELKGSDKE